MSPWLQRLNFLNAVRDDQAGQASIPAATHPLVANRSPVYNMHRDLASEDESSQDSHNVLERYPQLSS